MGEGGHALGALLSVEAEGDEARLCVDLALGIMVGELVCGRIGVELELGITISKLGPLDGRAILPSVRIRGAMARIPVSLG